MKFNIKISIVGIVVFPKLKGLMTLSCVSPVKIVYRSDFFFSASKVGICIETFKVIACCVFSCGDNP